MILHIVSDFKLGGVEVAVKSSIDYLNNNRLQYYVLVFGLIDNNFIKDLDISAQKKIIRLNYKSLTFFKDLIILISFLIKNKPSVFILSLWKSSLLGYFLKFFFKKSCFIFFSHSTTFFHFFDRFFSTLMLRRSDYVFVDSVSSQNFIKNNFRRDSSVISFLIKKIEIPNKKLLNCKIIDFLYVGRISQQKGLDRAIVFIAELNKLGINAKYHIYGEDDGFLNDLVNLSINLNIKEKIIFHGPFQTNQLLQVLNGFNFYLQCSLFEGMAMSVTEALQAGLVVVTTPVGEIKNYTSNKFNALHFRDGIEFVNEFKLLLNDYEYIKKISFNASITFKNSELYKESLLKNIYKLKVM